MSWETSLVYTYKDSYRNYWRILLDRTEVSHDEDGENHYYWDYKIQQEDGEWVTKWENRILGQYEIPPTAKDILIDYQFAVSCLAIRWS